MAVLPDDGRRLRRAVDTVAITLVAIVVMAAIAGLLWVLIDRGVLVATMP